MTNLTQEQLHQLCLEWQEVLRLQDWRVFLRVSRARELSGTDRQGECDWIQNRKEGYISLLDPVDYPPDACVPYDQELVLVHELLHLHFASFWPDKGYDDPECIAMEQAIEFTAQALVALKRKASA